jgi:hypothetical protein
MSKNNSRNRGSLNSEDDTLLNGVEDDTTLVSEEDLMLELQAEGMQTALPTIKPPPGWHYCWLSTTNQYDHLARRTRMGYQPVPAAEVPGAEYLVAKDGQFEGCITCNEMVLFKIPDRLYQMIMTHNHLTAPRQEQDKLSVSIKQNFRDSKYGDLAKEIGDGFVATDEDARPVHVGRSPIFT